MTPFEERYHPLASHRRVFVTPTFTSIIELWHSEEQMISDEQNEGNPEDAKM
jgi:hypothetical protein